MSLFLGGDANQTRTAVTLGEQAREQGTYVVGTTGTGKTTFLLNLILQDIEQGNDGICVLDPHGDFTSDLLVRIPPHRVNDVILLDPSDTDYPFGLNLFDCNRNDPRQRDRVVSTVIDTLYKLFRDSWGPRMEDLLRHAILSLLLHSEPTSLLDLMLVLTNHEHRQRLTARAKEQDPILRAYWEDQFPESLPPRKEGETWKHPKEQTELVGSSLNKIGRFLANPIIRNIICQPHSTINFREAMDKGKIVLINLSKGDLGPDNSALLGAVIVNQIFIAALSRREIPEKQRRRFHLYVDEYQTFATKTFPELQSEARKYAIDTTVAHQYRSQLDDDNLGSTLNVANLVVLRVSGRDAIELAAQYNLTPPVPEIRFEPYRFPVDEQEKIWANAKTQGTGEPLFEPVPGARQLYSDVHLETANLLAQLPNYEAICRILDAHGNLTEHRIQLRGKTPPLRTNSESIIRQNARKSATPRYKVEQYIVAHTKSSESDDGRYPPVQAVELS